MVHNLVILGSTGSVGRQTVSAALRLGIRVSALTANKNIGLLEEQARLLSPAFVAVYDDKAAAALKLALADTRIRVGAGEEGLIEAASLDAADAVMTAVSGSVGLGPTLAAISEKKRICLANKEALVCAGDIVMAAAEKNGAEIIPVDSEHSAIFQCLSGRRGELRKILLTASGGPFRGWSRARTESVTPEMAVAHPNWSMGAKISVDSATMMNKGLEIIEAMHLFNVSPEHIEVLIHPESVIHSMVELSDGAVIAQCGVPDMGQPIQYALTYPQRLESGAARLDFAALGSLTFERPDFDKNPCLALAVQAARQGGTAPAVLNAANEAAVSLFLERRIGFNQIYACVARALDSIDIIKEPTLEEILQADLLARENIKE